MGVQVLKRVLILGGGFAGVATARALVRRLKATDITLIDRGNASLFTPLLPEIVGGDLEMRHVVRPLRAGLPGVEVIAATVETIDLTHKSVAVRQSVGDASSSIAYDQLVLAMGSESSTFGLPGVSDWTIPFKTVGDALRLRNEVIRSLEAADVQRDRDERRRLLSFVVVGAGFTGVEVTGELHKFLHSALQFYRHVEPDDIRIALVDGASRLLPELPEAFGAYAERLLETCGIDIRLKQKVAKATDAGLVLGSNEVIPAQVVVWCAGLRAPDVIGKLPVPHGQGARIVVQSDFSIAEWPDVWAIGDCAQIPSSDGRPVPPTAQHAVREGPLLARNVVAHLMGKPTRPFTYRTVGMMASLGCGRGIVQLGRSRMIGGTLAWLLWRSYYLLQMPGWDRKMRVAADWTLQALSRRDIAWLPVDDRVRAYHA